MTNCMTIVLAGGKGSRLAPLTRHRAKPAVPFGGQYRIIDFTLSNCLNSGLRKILMLTQYKCMSLDRHINLAWRQYFCGELGEFIDILPPQHRIDETWYRGTADAVYQNIYSIEQNVPELVLILAGDHIYKMNYAHMLQFHRDSGAQLTIGALTVPRAEATQFGVMEIDSQSRVVGFEEKPSQPRVIPGQEERSLASMGIYVFDAQLLCEKLCVDAVSQTSHDFGKDVIPAMIQSGDRVYAFPFCDARPGRKAYWRDVGTLDAYYQASMDLVSAESDLDIYDRDWPIRTQSHPSLPPSKFLFDANGDRQGTAVNSIVAQGSVLAGAHVERCVLGRDIRAGSRVHLQDSVVFDGADIGRGSKIRRAIIDKRVSIPAHTELGFDTEYDRDRGFHVSESGIVVITSGDRFRHDKHHLSSCLLRVHDKHHGIML